MKNELPDIKMITDVFVLQPIDYQCVTKNCAVLRTRVMILDYTPNASEWAY